MIYPRLLFVSLCIAALACNNSSPKQTADSSAVPPTEDTLSQMPGGGPKPAVSTDEQLFETAFGSFKTAVEQNSEEQLKGLMHFPVQTSKGELRDADFHSKYNDVRNVVPKAGDEQTKEVGEAEHAELRKVTDKDSKLFEVHAAKTVWVFGKVEGSYKILGYYSK